MDRDALAQRLMGTFLGELDEHVRALNRGLLALEKDPTGEDGTELFKTLFRTVHSLKGAARSVSVSLIEGACHRLEEVLGAARDGRLLLGPDVFQLLFAAADALGDAGGRLREGRDLAGAALVALLPRLDALTTRAAARPPSPALPLPAPAAGSAPLGSPGGDGSVRVTAEKLDALLARSGELLVARRRVEGRGADLARLREFVARWQAEWRGAAKPLARLLHQNGAGSAHALGRTHDNLHRLEKALEQLEAGLAKDARMLGQAAVPLEDEVRRVRMLPFAEACQGLERSVRDLARAGGKEVDLVVEGGAVELDRSVLDGLKAPLLHLVRNAVDHGLETAAERRAAGKPSRARVRVAAALRGARIEVVVDDDGRGLDPGAIREQARKKQLPEPRDDSDLARLVFLTGFSTSRVVTEVSGRGMGLDVVRDRVESLHGTIDLAFEAGRGVRFVLTVPLTLTTIRALLVTAAGQTFALAGTNVLTLLRVGRGDLPSVEGREVVSLGGTSVPVASLAETLGLPPRDLLRAEGKAPVVIVAAGEKRMGFVVDDLLAEQEVVVKSLGPRLKRVRNVAGATILPTGRVALLLSAADLIRSARGRPPAGRLPAALDEAAPAAKRRLLVVDDSVTTRSLVKSILEAAGYDVAVAADGAEAWQLLQERGAALLVADVDMPRMDGFALTEAVRGSKRFGDLPVILVTALESEADKARGIAVGADAYLPKSAFDQTQLLETIAQLL